MTMKKVCIDAYNLSLPQGTGIATYSRNLLTSLKAMHYETQAVYGPASSVSKNHLLNEIMLTDVTRASKKNRFQKIDRYIKTRTSFLGRQLHAINHDNDIIWPNGSPPNIDKFWAAKNLFQVSNRSFALTGAITPVSFRGESPDVMHWTCPIPLRAKKIPNIYTFHDLIPLKLPHTTLDDKSKYYDLCKKLINKADHIATISETSKKDLIKFCNADERKISVTYQAVNIDPELLTKNQIEIENELSNIFNLEWKKYFIHFGAIEPKKNLANIVEAYATSGSNLPLIIIGKKGWLEENQTRLLNLIKSEDNNISKNIRQYDYMPYNLLISLIRGARSTVFPSLYEGFGLPILESMSLGTSVITSEGGATAEVAGHAGIYVNPHDVTSIRDAIRSASCDYDYVKEQACQGMSIAARFSENAYQDRLAEMYKWVI